jgi:hypothetical protein
MESFHERQHMDLHPGQMLGPYRIEERLVSGGMAKVYRALQASTGREVALKVLPAINADAESVTRFQREMRVLAGLQHPHILGLIDAGQDGPWHYLVLPLVRRGDLADVVAREDGPLPLAQARRIVLQLCDALDYAHAQGVVHRDLKPANVLLDERGNCLLTDFGIALPENATRLTAVGFAVGTPEYLAPEQAEGRADARSDLYALGLVLFELVTGRRPFDARGSAGWLQAHRDAPVPAPRALNAALPPALDAVVLKALAKRPEDRYQNAREFAAAVRGALAEAVYAEGALPMPEAAAATATLRAPVRRSRLALTAAAMAVLGVAIAIGWRFVRDPQAAPPVAADAAHLAATPDAAQSAQSPSGLISAAPAQPADGRAATPTTPAAEIQPASSPKRGDADVFDAFDDPRFESRFDAARWQPTSPTARMQFAQREGRLHLRSQEREHGLLAQFADTRIARVSARVRMTAPVTAAQASIGITLSRGDAPGQWVSCYVYATRGATTATPACTDQRRSEFRSGAPAATSQWHDVALRVDSGHERALLAVDGADIGELPLGGGAANATWYLLLSGWSNDGAPVEGDIAEVAVEHEP